MGLNEPACTSIGKSKTTTTAETSSKRTGRARRATTTSAKSTGPSSPALTLCVADSPVSRSPWPGSDEARQMTVTSGRKWSAALTLSGPLGSLAKMCLESSIWASTKCVLTWKVSATPSGRCVYRLVPSMRRTSGNGSGLWPTVTAATGGDGQRPDGFRRLLWPEVQRREQLWPTPHANCRTGAGHAAQGGKNIQTVVAMFPTPNARDHKDSGPNVDYEKLAKKSKLAGAAGGSLNPNWVEALMGYPVGWTDISGRE